MPIYVSALRLRLALTENALDSLQEGMRHFAERLRPNDLKYALLLTAQSVEMFLKARLGKEHRLLILKDPGDLSPSPRTVDCAGALSRLSAAGVALSRADVNDVQAIRDIRNRLEHYEVDILEEDAERALGRAFAFLDRFLAAELNIALQDHLPEESYFIAKKASLDYQEALRRACSEIENRLRSIPPDERAKYQVLECDFCGQMTVLYPNPDQIPPSHVRCYFCDQRHVVARCTWCGALTTWGEFCEHCMEE